MMTFRGERLKNLILPAGVIWLLEKFADSRVKQPWEAERHYPGMLVNLHELAVLESVESSNRIDAITVEPERLRLLVNCNARPQDRSEEEIVGYRNALTWIHENHAHGHLAIEPATLRRLHALAQEGTVGDAGCWKESQNEIIELDPEGKLDVRFQPVEPCLVPAAIEELCLAYNRTQAKGEIPALLAIAALVFDFLCIHPFREANGRVSRLLSLLALYRTGYRIGRYISLERIIEQSQEHYYDALRRSSVGWHDGTHDILPWFHYFLSMVHTAYREFEDCVAVR
jgi:Fic family protein